MRPACDRTDLRGGALAALAALWVAAPLHAETPAGTAITNVARMTYATPTGAATVDSNEQRLIVAERLDVALTADGASGTADATVAHALLTNRGNGQEAFALTAAVATGAVRFALDSDGDGRYDPARDADLPDGRTPVLEPGRTIGVFAIPAPAAGGPLTLTATALTGAGAPGTVFAGQGDGGGDAVVGPTGARASIGFAPGGGAGAAPTLAKTATVVAPDGSARAMRGATITYALVARFPGAAQDVRFADPIPAGTQYLPGSLTLDGARLSDAADADPGDVTPVRVAIALGDQPAGAERAIRFKVVIQ